MSAKTTHAYVARKADGSMPGYYAACVDDQSRKRDVAKFIAECVREGGIVERVTCEEAGKGLSDYWNAKQAKRKAQGVLL